MAKVFISIGSNLGNRSENINRAIDCLRNTEGIIIEAISSIIESEPAEGLGPSYLNGVVKIRTDLGPHDLLVQLQSIEKALGRVRTYKNAPRIIDLDILLYGQKVIAEPNLTIPHPRMWERDFVMGPLLEIEPDIEKRFKDRAKRQGSRVQGI